jgi:isocitrate/isopropylmalate dehydrogenase
VPERLRVLDAAASAFGLNLTYEHFDHYVSLRPVKLMSCVLSPLTGRAPGDVDVHVVRENTEGEPPASAERSSKASTRPVPLATICLF